MTSVLPSLFDGLRDARIAKGWSQRELSERTGLPQPHISRIESGALDPKLSTLVEMARALDLELFLAPRSAAGAIRAVVREGSALRDESVVRRAALDLVDAVARLRVALPKDRSVERLSGLARDLPQLAPLFAASDATPALADYVQQVTRLAAEREPQRARVEHAVRELVALRNRLVHARPERPAYSLDEVE